MSNKRKKQVVATRGNMWQSAWRNNDYYIHYYQLLEEMACATLKWEGLPDEIDRRFLSMTIFNRGLSVFFYEEEYGRFFSTLGTPGGEVNMYQNPTRFMAYGAGGFSRMLDANDCVPIWANYLRVPPASAFRIYARQLADIAQTIAVQLQGHKMPTIVTGPEAKRQTLYNLLKQWQGNEPVIFGVDSLMDGVSIDYLSSKAPYIIGDLYDQFRNIWCEALSYIGVDNSPVDKAERVQSAEVWSNNKAVEVQRLTRFDCLRDACEQVNRKYGLEVWVDFNGDWSSERYGALMMEGLDEDDAEAVNTPEAGGEEVARHDGRDGD